MSTIIYLGILVMVSLTLRLLFTYVQEDNNDAIIISIFVFHF